MLLTSRWVGRIARVLVMVVALVWFAPVPASADDPLRLDEQLTDRAGVLDGRRAQAEAALRQLRDQTRLQLFVVFVHSFDGTQAQEWADDTARRSDLGDRDVVLAVATRDRAYAYSFDADYPLTDAQLDQVAATAIEPALARNDWAGAVVAAADGYRAVAQGQPVPAPRIVPGQPDTGGSGGVPVAGVVLGLLAVAVVALGGWLWWRRHRPAGRRIGPAGRRIGPAGKQAGASTEELANRANALLVELDDELRTSQRELDLATGQYGAQATVSFAAALDFARQEATEAFRLRMALDDGSPGESPEDEATRRQLLTEIIRRCEVADQRLDAEAEAFDRLRELETHVEQSVSELTGRRAAAQARLPAAETELARLHDRYATEALAAVSGNVTQARERLAFAGAALDRAGAAAAAGQRPVAAVAVRAAEEALSQAGTLLDAVARVGAELATARAAVDPLLVEVRAGLAAARAAAGSQGNAAAGVRADTAAALPVEAAAAAPVDAAVTPQAQTDAVPGAEAAALVAAVSTGEQAVAAVRAMLAAPRTDPLAAVRQLREADAALDRALAGARDAAERAARARGMLDQSLPVARAEVSTVGDFIATRRGAVTSQARVWLAEAQRHLARAEALAATDPVTALSEVQQASRLADQAGQAARADVAGWAPPGGGFAGGRGRFARGRGGGFTGPGGFAGGGSDALAGFAGALLGGILAGGSGPGYRRSGYGWGRNGFGGSGARARHWAGGGSGGGRRRGGGGRF